MSCAGKGYGTNPYSDAYLSSHFSSNANNRSNANTSSSSTRNCRKFQGSYPSFVPTIERISISSSKTNTYSEVHVIGTNFLPNNTTYIQFGNVNIPVTYYSSFNISFIVPLNASVGNHPVRVINIYNNNFSPSVTQSYPGNINVSNTVFYTIT